MRLLTYPRDILGVGKDRNVMANPERWKGRPMPGPVTLAACMIELIERLYARTLALAPNQEVADATLAEWEEFRNEWKPLLERIIYFGR